MIGLLDTLRDLLEDLGGGLGVTDPVSGDVVANLQAPRVTKKARKKKRAAKKPQAKKRKRR
jgi:hypothetical protein